MTIELHLLQSVPPANLNRDDTGAPKETVFGGHRRARLSSQSLKRAIRTSPVFRDAVGGRVGIRTKRAPEHVAKLLADTHGIAPDAARALAEATLQAIFGSGIKDNGETSVLYYAGRPELADLAARVADAAPSFDALVQSAVAANAAVVVAADGSPEGDPKTRKAAVEAARKPAEAARKALETALKASVVAPFVKAHRGRTAAADVALFGRMLAEEPALGLEASCQVAHAISVDRVAPEFDYYTAVDDLKDTAQGDDAGAGMIGTTGYNAAVYYRYAVLDTAALTANLAGDAEAARDAAAAFLTASVVALPSGKQNSFAARVRPELVLAVVRPDGQPLSLANAFLVPVAAGTQGIAAEAVARLADHRARMEAMYAGLLSDAPAAAHVATLHEAPFAGAEGTTVYAAVRDVIAHALEAAFGPDEASAGAAP